MAALMTAKICALLLGGAAVGSVSTVAVQHKVSPRQEVAVAKGKQGGLKRSGAPVRRPEPAERPASPRILDCPITGSPYGLEPSFHDLARTQQLASATAPGFHPLLPGSVVAGGGGTLPIPPSPPPIPPAVPEPDAWAFLLAGFALVGASLRRNIGEKEAHFTLRHARRSAENKLAQPE